MLNCLASGSGSRKTKVILFTLSLQYSQIIVDPTQLLSWPGRGGWCYVLCA